MEVCNSLEYWVPILEPDSAPHVCNENDKFRYHCLQSFNNPYDYDQYPWYFDYADGHIPRISMKDTHLHASLGCHDCQFLVRVARCYDTRWLAAEVRVLVRFNPEGLLQELVYLEPGQFQPPQLVVESFVRDIPRPFRHDDRRSTLLQIQPTRDRLRRLTFEPDPVTRIEETTIQACIAQCRQHTSCDQPDPHTLPTRLLDLGPSAHGARAPSVRLVSSADLQNQPFYCALSYCWGKTARALLKSDCLSTWMRGPVPQEALPASVQDAIRVTAALGVRYLWVDFLCILQDSSSDWQTESARMGDYYQNALLTLAAHTAPNASTPWLDGSLQAIRWLQPMPRDSHRRQAGVSVPGVEVGLHQIHIDEPGPLSTRAWAFQESLLSSRVLHFLEGYRLFQCRHGASRDGLSANDTASAQFHKMLNGNTHGLHERCRIWSLLISLFARTHLTVLTDILPAISAVAAVFSESRFGLGQYHGGIWGAAIFITSDWYSLLPQRCHRPGILSHTYIAPTFSWASRTGSVQFSFADDSKVRGPGYFDHFTASSTPPISTAPFGQLRAAWLKGKVLLCQAQIGHECRHRAATSNTDFTTKAQAPRSWIGRAVEEGASTQLPCGCIVTIGGGLGHDSLIAWVVRVHVPCADDSLSWRVVGQTYVRFDTIVDAIDALGHIVYCVPLVCVEAEQGADHDLECVSMMFLRETGEGDRVFQRIGWLGWDEERYPWDNGLPDFQTGPAAEVHQAAIDESRQQLITIV